MRRADARVVPAPSLAAALGPLVDELAGTAHGDGAPIAAGDHSWRAARALVAALARAILAQRGEAAAGNLFTVTANDRTLTVAADAAVAAHAGPLPKFAELADAYPHLLLPTARKRSGAWFTAPTLTRPTVRRTLAPFASAAAGALRILDPAVGGGAFLLAALRERTAAGRDPALVATTELHGLDLDPTAASLAAWTLHEACGATPPPIDSIERHVRCGDGLLELEDETFDAVIGNPPWETLQLGRAEPGSDDAAQALARRLAALRARFCRQGRGKLYTYRLFVERALRLLRPGGRLGLVLPASLYFDRDAEPLRRSLLEECTWEWLFGFENRRRLFAIDSRYRFGPIVAQKGGTTSAVRTAFLRTDPDEWCAEAPPHLHYHADDVRRLSPHSGAFVEIRDERDLALLRRMAAAGRPLLGSRGLCRWRQGDYNMTTDLPQFRRRDACEGAGLAPRDDGTWRRDGEPGHREAGLRALYQGAMLGVLHPNAGAYAGGSGRATRWRQPRHPDRLEPQYLVPARQPVDLPPARVAIRALSNATNERTAFPCLLADEPCGNSLGVLWPRTGSTPLLDTALTAGVLGTFVWDWALRQRLCGTNVNGFVLADTWLPDTTTTLRRTIAQLALQLCAILPWHAGLWRGAAAEGWLSCDGMPPPPTAEQRRELLARLEVATAQAFGLCAADLDWILRDCDHDTAALRDPRWTRRLDPKGFWRTDRSLPPDQRLTQQIRRLAKQLPPASP